MQGTPAITITDADGHPVHRSGGVWRAQEAQRLRVRIEGGPWELDLNGRGLAWDQDLPGVVLATPFAVGRLTLTLRGEGRVHEVPVDVEAAESKLGADLWEALLADLEDWLPGLSAGIEGPLQGGLGLDGLDLPSAVEAVLPLVPAFEQSIRRVLDAPRQRTVTELADRPLHRAQRATAETLAWISRHPREAAWLRPETDGALAGPPPMLPLPLSYDTLDHPANRHLVWLIRRVVRRLQGAADVLGRAACSELNDTLAWRNARCAALQVAARRLQRLDRTGPLRDVQGAPATEAALMVLLDAPAYARAHRLGRRILRGGLQTDAPPAVATRPSYHLYELWCFLAIARGLRQELGGGWSWRLRKRTRLLDLAGTGSGAWFEGKGPGDEEVRVLFNPRFSSLVRFDSPAAPAKRHAVTRERRPDIVVTRRSGDQRSWVALDAKYRVGVSALADAFSSAHIYRDSLRWPKFGGPPRAAALLSPRADAGTALWFAPWFAQRHGVGAIALAPGADVGPAIDSLLSLLRPQEPTS